MALTASLSGTLKLKIKTKAYHNHKKFVLPHSGSTFPRTNFLVKFSCKSEFQIIFEKAKFNSCGNNKQKFQCFKIKKGYFGNTTNKCKPCTELLCSKNNQRLIRRCQRKSREDCSKTTS